MELNQTYSITPPKQQELYSPEHLDSLALQFSMAQEDLSPNTMELNRLRLQNGDEELMKSELVQKSNAERKGISANILDTALREGNVALAEGVVRGNVPQETASMVVPNLAADYASVIKDSDLSHVTTPEDLGLDTQKNARLLAFNNALNEVLSEYEKAYAPGEEDWEYLTNIPVGVGAPNPVLAQPKIAKMTKDVLMTFVNSIYSFAKSGASISFLLPGTKSAVTSSELFDPNITDEEFNKRLNAVRENVLNYYLSDNFRNNPLAAKNLLIDSIGTGQLDNPAFKELADIKTVIDEAGKPQENLLKKTIDPESKITGFFMEPVVQNIIDNPLFDIPIASAGISMIKALFGSSTAGKILANQIKTGKVTAANWRYLTQMNYPGGIQDPELLASVQKNLDFIESGLEASVETRRVDASPVQIAAEQARIQRTEFPGKDLAYFEHIVEQNNQFIGVNLQARSGTPFFSEASARQAANARGITDYKVVPNARGNGFLIQVRRSMDEAGMIDSTIPKDPAFIRTLFGIGKYMHSPNVYGTRSQRFGGTNAASNVAGYAKLYTPLIEKFSALSTKEIDNLSDVILKGMRTPHPSDPSGRTLGKWFTDTEFNQQFITIHQRPATFAEREAYQAYRMAYDLDYVLMNKAKYDKLSSVGVNHYAFTGINNLTDPVLGKVVDNTGAISEEAKFLLSNGTVVDKAGAKAAIANPDNIVVSVYGRMTWGDNEITHIIHDRGSVSSSGLNRFVLGYTEGGTRRYAEPFLVKQDGLDGNIITHAIFPSKKMADEYSRRMESVAREFRDYRAAVARLGPNSNAQAINALRRQYDANIQAAHDGYTLQRVEDEFLRGKFNPDTEFVALFDGEKMPREGILGDPNLQSYQYKGGLYYSPRGEHLTDGYIGQYAEVVPPFEALSNQLSHAVRMAGYSDFAIKEVNSWMAKYGKYLELKEPNIRFPSDDQIFRDGVWRQSIKLSWAQKEQAEAQRMHILREMRHVDTLGAKIVEFKTNLAKTMAVSLGDSKLAEWIPDAVRRGTIVTETDAINFLKSWNYVTKMAFFYPGQFFLQGSSSALVAARGGINGIPAMKDSLFILMAGASDFNNKVVKLLDTEASLALGYKKGDFTKMLYDWQRTQLKEVGSIEGTLDVATRVENMSGPISRLFRKVDEYGRLFTYKGEELVNAVAFGIARREAIDLAKKGKFPLGSDEYIAWIRGRSNELQGNPRSGASFWWQRNDATSVAMQMLNWSWKQTEGFLFLDRSMTTAERLRFIAASVALWGASGFPGGTAIADYYYKNTGREVSIEELKNVYYGAVDSVFRNIGEMDTAFAARMAPGTLFTTLYTDIFDTKSSMFETMGGVTSSSIVDVNEMFPAIGQILAVAKLRNAESAETDWGAIFDAGDLIFAEVASLTSSWNTASKAYIAAKTGFEVNRKKNSITNYNAESYPNFLRYMGIATADETLAFKLNERSKDRDKITWDFANGIVEQRIRYQIAFQNKDISAMKTAEMATNYIASMVPKGLETEVDRKAASIMRNPTVQKRLEEATVKGFIK